MNLADQRSWTSFLQRMSKQYSGFGLTRTPKDIAQLLQKNKVIYKPESEVEIEKLIGRLLGETKRQEILERMKPPPPIPCKIEGCEGELLKRGKLQVCSIGGWRHVFVAEIAAAQGLDARKLLERHEQIHAEWEMGQKATLEEWREGMKVPFPVKAFSE